MSDDSFKNISKKIYSSMVKAINKYKLIQDNDRILIAVSGGKDSMTMSYFLRELQKNPNFNFQIKAVHVGTDFLGCPIDLQIMLNLLKNWGIETEVLDVPVIGRLKDDKKMNCYWCSTQRRLEIFQYATEHSFNKVAFGHHMDDILQTFFMNMLQKGTLTAMMPKMPFDKYPQIIIRPLALTHEEDIEIFTKDLNIKDLTITYDCPFGKLSKRIDVKEKIKQLTDGSRHVKEMMYKSLENPDYKYLLTEDNF